MNHLGLNQSSHGLQPHGITRAKNVYWNCPPAFLFEYEIKQGRGCLSERGAFVATADEIGRGRSPKDKYIVEEATTKDKIWWGKVNTPVKEEVFDALHKELTDYLADKDLFVQDVYAGADPEYRVPVRTITEYAYAAAFVHTMFVNSTPEEQKNFVPGFTVIAAPGYRTDPQKHGIRSGVFIIANFAKKLILVGGSAYSGEIKKSIFSVLNHHYPSQGILSMHCSANIGKDGDTAIFFGLSGTGKTTLSADPERGLIGDDEHGWSDKGVFNFEGGCYAKCIHLSPEFEPQIWNALRFGAIMENVVMDSHSRVVDFDDSSLTENTRAAYPLEHIDNAVFPSVGGHPKNVIFLTCDAYGVLPPIARLTPAQAMYHFISGYTARVAGTERGVTEPQATFSACFGAPFVALHPSVYAELLGKKLQRNGTKVWLVNTGWSGGPYGVGQRMSIKISRAVLRAALSGALEQAHYSPFPHFGFEIPDTCPGVPPEVLNPKNTWPDKNAYDEKAKHVAKLFIDNFKQFEAGTAQEILNAAPKI